ncbi:Magnesium transporter NIPA [Sesbania bispinosa]|nr:Magnesium transporter NIPA [Sesbania bispinosa]
MGLSKENLKGLILALVSSGFIGASFIIKKQGLRRAAAASGVRAGVGGYYYLLEPLWWVGMITREVANFVAYAFAPAVLVTPLGALSIIVSLKHIQAKEYDFMLKVMSVKALGTSLKLTFEGKNQLIYPETWFFMLVVAICVVMQMNYLNKALDTFNTAIVSPIYYVMFTTLTILASVIMFKDWDGQSGGTIVSEVCGFIVVLSGTIMLHATKDFERSSSFRGSAPSSPTLSVRLYTGNGDLLLKQDEENVSPEREGDSFPGESGQDANQMIYAAAATNETIE